MESNNIFITPLQEFTYIRTYSRWLESEGRRETWRESVARYIKFLRDKYGDKVSDKEYKDMQAAILGLEVMPSMRAMWAAGPAAEQEPVSIYNCSFIAIENIKDFAEILYILMNGVGVGFSVEKAYISNLPVIKDVNGDPIEHIIFEDSKLGWAKGFEKVLNCLWNGVTFSCDYSKIRPRGARLKTFGGRASGSEPLMDLIKFTSAIVEQNRGYKLQPIDCHDICCKIAEVVIVGGVRRSALISLSDLADNQMAHAKSGEFWKVNPHRQTANNSVAYTRKPDVISFLDGWKDLIASKTGERGMFNRVAAQKKAAENGRRNVELIAGMNPCGEILLRSHGLCNLTEVVIRAGDDFNTLKRKVKIATLIGTLQAGFTDFKYIPKVWKQNAEEEALLGVSLTGLRDHKILGSINDEAKKWLADLKHVAISTNKKIAEKVGLNRAAAITCTKPSGTVSLLVDSSAGAHIRKTRTGYYIRRVRISATDSLCQLLRAAGVPLKPETGQHMDSCNTLVVEFPCKAPVGAQLQGESAEAQLGYWKMIRDFWCEHNPSITIDVMDDEWLDTAAWVYKNFDHAVGLTFMPVTHVYQLAPYEDIDKETYERMVKEFPVIDYSQLSRYEQTDQTEGAKEYACHGGACEIL